MQCQGVLPPTPPKTLARNGTATKQEARQTPRPDSSNGVRRGVCHASCSVAPTPKRTTRRIEYNSPQGISYKFFCLWQSIYDARGKKNDRGEVDARAYLASADVHRRRNALAPQFTQRSNEDIHGYPSIAIL